MVRLTIDGFPVEVEKGTTILHVAEKARNQNCYSLLYRGSSS
ncbi:MAG: 2Fe-2S iron-sulfur cluster-binding protein [Lachnospiraceae bacterium]